MRNVVIILLTGLLCADLAAETVCHTFGGKNGKYTFPDTLKVSGTPAAQRLIFDLSALPKDAGVHRARLNCVAGGQPREAVQVFAGDKVDAAGKPLAGSKPLELQAPEYRSFDVTEHARAWVQDPAKNQGIVAVSFEGLQAARCSLEIWHEGMTDKAPPQVANLKVIHHDGQTFLCWQELPIFRPAPDKIVYIDDFANYDAAVKDPGNDKMGNPRIPGVRLDTLRGLQGLAVRTQPGAGQEMPKFVRVRELPEVRYRVYRSTAPITPATFKDAMLAGQATPLNAYNERMVRIYSHGEYYGKHEQADNVIGTFCLADFQGILPGHAFYVHTPAAAGKAYYAVTAMQDGIENCAISAANSCAQPVEEKVELPKPTKYYSMATTVRAKHDKATTYSHLFWAAPPFANLPENRPKQIEVSIPADFKEPGPMLVNLGAGGADTAGTLMLGIEQAGDLCYNDGQNTYKSYRESKLDNFPERYVFHLIDWARGNWKVDPALISGTKGMSLHLAIRHPELFGVFWPDRPEFFANDFDQKWNPAGYNLSSRVGPQDLIKTADGSPGWEIFNMCWYLKQNPGKDIPFMGCLFTQPKDGNHGAEYGWQDDPKGWAALRDWRQPYLAQWGGGSVARQVRETLFKLRWDRSVPAFSNCSMDNNPGNGDPDDGDPWGQLNGYLLWQYDDIEEGADKWAMTVFLVGDAPREACSVDITPRHCTAFKPKAGAKFTFTNTSVAGNKPVQSGELVADQWGLLTIKGTPVTRGKNRIVIAAVK